MTTQSLPDPVLSRSFDVDAMPFDGHAVTLVTTAAERTALARLNGLVAVPALSASLRVRPEPGGGVRVTGDVVADVTQTCVVSLEPFDAAVREPVDVLFVSPAGLAAFRADAAKFGGSAEEEASLDEPDLIVQGRIDLGALVAEHFTLGLDPYPRKPGATLAVKAEAAEPSASPFAVLRLPRGERS